MDRTSRGTCLVFLLFISACRPHGIESVPLDAGQAREFPAEFGAVRDASAEAVLEENLSIERTLLPDDTTAMLVAKLSGTGLNPGQWFRVVITKSGPRQTVVRIYEQQVIAVRGLPRRDLTDSIFATVAVKLGVADSTRAAPAN